MSKQRSPVASQDMAKPTRWVSEILKKPGHSPFVSLIYVYSVMITRNISILIR